MRSQSTLIPYGRRNGYAMPDPHVGIRWIDGTPMINLHIDRVSVAGTDEDGDEIIARDVRIYRAAIVNSERFAYAMPAPIYIARARVDGIPGMVEIKFSAEHIFKVNC